MPLLSHLLPCFVIMLLFRLFIWLLSKSTILGMSIICFSFTPGCSITTIENQASILKVMITPSMINYSQEKILHTRRPELRFLRSTQCTVCSSFSLFAVFDVKWKIKKTTMVDFNNKVLDVWLTDMSICIDAITFRICG